ncbi:hypothetical protein MR772_06775, partial [bacterium]|nr:hypothetical protein [bacterium]
KRPYFCWIFRSFEQDLQLVQTLWNMYNSISLCFILPPWQRMIRSVLPRRTNPQRSKLYESFYGQGLPSGNPYRAAPLP